MPAAINRRPEYSGPDCPYCRMPFGTTLLQSGFITCPRCQKQVEATAFAAPQRRLHVVEVAQTGPEGANACANHGRNSATTSCQRCGLLICALCDMNVGAGSYCPACFDRLNNEGTLEGVPSRTPDYGAIALLVMLAGLFLWWVPLFGVSFGPLAGWYASKSIRQRRSDGGSTIGAYVVFTIGILETVGSGSWTAFMIWSFTAGMR